MAKKFVNASKNAGFKTNRITKRPVTTFVNASKREEDKNQGGILGGTGYLLGNLGLGLAGVGEGVSDILSAGGDLLRGDTEMAKYRFKDNQTAEAREKLEKDYNPGTVMKLAGDVSSGIGNSLTFMIPYVGPYLAGAGYVGMGISDAASKTGDVGGKELAYGAASGALEFGLDAITGGAGKAAKNLGASITRKLGREAAQAGAKATGKLAGKSFGKSVLVESLKGAGGEALEESLSELIDPQLQKLFGIDKNAETSLKNVAYAGLIGAISGGLMTAGPAAINYKNAASVGKQIRESGETEDFIRYTNDVLKAAQRTQTKYATAAEAAKAPADASVVQKFNAALNPLSAKNKSNRAKKRVEAIADIVQKNLNTLQQYRQNPTKTPKELEIADAVLGELRGNVFLLENASLLEYYEDAILDLSDEDKQSFVDEVNRRAKNSGAKKSDYTVEDLNNNTDDILTSVAAWRIDEDQYGDLFTKARKATQTAETTAQPAQEAAQATEGGKSEEAPAQPANAVKKRFVGNGEVRIAGGKKVKDLNLSNEQYTAYKAAEILAPTTGADIELHESLDKDGKTANGYYDPATNTFHININAKRGTSGKQIALYTLGHETTHYIKEWSPAKYDELASFVMDKLGGNTESLVSSKADFLRTISDYQNKTDAEIMELAREEVVADGMELILTDGKVLDELARTDRTLWQKVKSWIENIISKIRKAYADLNQASKTAQTLKETLDSLEEVERLFTEGVKDAGEQTRKARAEIAEDTNGKKYSVDEESAESPDVEEIETDTEQELTDRDMLLAMAEQLVGNEQEAKILADYKAKYEEQKARQNRWNELNEQMQELQSTLWTSDKSTERSEAAKKLQGIYQEMGKISEKMADVDSKMFEITNMKVIRNLLKREYVKARDVQKEKYKRIFEQRTAAKETTEARRSVRRIYNRVNRLMFSPNRKRGVPYEMQPIVAEALKTANMNAEELQKLANLEERLSKLEKEAVPDEQKIANLEKQIENQEKKTATIKKQTQFMIDLFEKTKEIKEGVGANVFDETALEMLKKLQKEIGNSSIRNMKKEQLLALKDFYDMLYERITKANKTFATEKALDIDELGTKANNEVVKSEPLKVLSPTGKEWKGMTWARKYFWANMKPLTVFEALGSETLQDLFQKVLDGEDVWARDLMEAYEFLEGAKKKYGYNKWDLTKRSEVKTANGQTVSLTLGEKMSLYAYMFRDQAEKHLSDGGFTFAPDAETIEEFQQGLIKYEAVLNDQTQYKMRKEDIAVMSDSLTNEQKEFAKAVQEYITSLGKKGNEVSKKLYGINLFNEQFYFPIRSNRDYLAESTGKSGDPNIKSRGTFKETVPDAGNPIVLEDFMKVVSQHINNMATYHAFVLPIEDLTRVWNYTPANIKRDENGKAILDKNGMPVADDDSNRSYNSLKAEITKKYGKQANEYILNLIRDLNGGARRDAAASILDKGITAFKRAATSLSLSTIIQQPTSVFRAMSIIDKKYFTGAEMVDWEEIKKLAPVAFIKEMGGHDTSTGARTDEFLNAKTYDNTGDKIKAMLKPKAYGGDPQARAEAFGWLTGKADEVAWRYMFGACINEQADKLGKPKTSQEVKEAAAKRFTEVVRKTQVYDSTLTRSQFMRSKDNLMKIVTSFGAEPTTVMSMLADGIIKLQRGDKMALRTIAGAVALSVLANALASSVIYAMRDDDEDETLAEKYVQSLTSEVIEGINPLEYLPIARDVMSLFKGYEIERTDMTLVSNLFEQVELITSSKRSLADKIFGVSGAVSAFFGVPVTNIYRDAKGMLNTAMGFFDPESQTGAGFKHAIGDSVRGQFSLISKLIGAESGNAYELYQAYVRGDTAHYNRVRARYESPQAAELALRQALRDNDPRIYEAAQARISGELDVYESIVEQIEQEGVFDRNIVIRAVNNEINAINNDTKTTTVPKAEDEEEDAPEQLYKSSDLNAALERGDEDDFLDVYASLLSYKMDAGKTEAQARSAVKSSITAYWKKRYLAAWEANDTKEIKRIQDILLSTGLYGTRNEVAQTGQDWIKAYAESKNKTKAGR